MGLISDEVEVVWHPKTRKHYENLGYTFTNWKDGFIIPIEHLTYGSGIKIDVRCDYCGKELKNIKWQDYKKNTKENGKYYCLQCALSLYANKNTINTKLVNGISFEQWCINNSRRDILELWDYKLNNCKSNEILYKTSKKYYFKCPRGLHESELKRISDLTSKKCDISCKKCGSFAQWGIDNLGVTFIEKYWSSKNIVDPFKIPKNYNNKIWLKCISADYHDDYSTRSCDFINGSKCPLCSNRNGKVHPLDSLGKLLEDKGLLHLWSDKNKKSSYEYAPMSGESVYWKCINNLHEDFLRGIHNSNNYVFRCPECQYSKGEEQISNYFINKGLIKISEDDYKLLDNVFKDKYTYYVPQKKFDGLVGLGNGLLSYDFYLPNLQYNLLIEYDGEFHYKPIRNYKNEPIEYAEERLKKQQIHDRLKDEYAREHGINLLRIPYWDYDKIEKILDKHLKDILITKVI